jgi:hypothetical protein
VAPTRGRRRSDRLEALSEPVGGPVAAAPEGVEIRPGRPGDVPAFLPFWRQAIADERTMRTDDQRTTAAEYRRRFRRSWNDDEAHIVAVEGGRVVGYVMVGRDRTVGRVNQFAGALSDEVYLVVCGQPLRIK